MGTARPLFSPLVPARARSPRARDASSRSQHVAKGCAAKLARSGIEGGADCRAWCRARARRRWRCAEAFVSLSSTPRPRSAGRSGPSAAASSASSLAMGRRCARSGAASRSRNPRRCQVAGAVPPCCPRDDMDTRPLPLESVVRGSHLVACLSRLACSSVLLCSTR